MPPGQTSNSDSYQIAQGILKRMKETDPQYELNGQKNIWIVKPGSKSRGEGIQVFNSLDDILDYTKKDRVTTSWVV